MPWQSLIVKVDAALPDEVIDVDRPTLPVFLDGIFSQGIERVLRLGEVNHRVLNVGFQEQ